MKLLSITLGLILALALLFLAIDAANTSATERAYARVAAIRAASDARLDATAAFLPYAILGVSSVFAAALVFLGVTLVVRAEPARANPVPATRVIERRIVWIVAPPGASRRELYKLIEGGNHDD